MQPTAAPTQRPTRWSLGCALVTDLERSGMPGPPGLPVGRIRPEYVSNKLASRGSSPV